MAALIQRSNVVVRQVWESNLQEEIDLIQRNSWLFRFVTIDTEFPGTVFRPDAPKHALSSLSPDQHYANMKQNVDALNIIQLGLTLSDSDGNLPRFGPDHAQHVWQLNFRDFDAERDLCNPDSISLLKRHGVNFAMNKEKGIHSQTFARIFHNSGLGRAPTWITFHGLYDFGFLIKILTGKALPEDLNVFKGLMKSYFGLRVYDLKIIARAFGLHGGLEKVAMNLGLDQAARKSHQTGSNSLLTKQAFFQLARCYNLLQFNYKLYGLTCNF